jgi:hypothetical protein
VRRPRRLDAGVGADRRLGGGACLWFGSAHGGSVAGCGALRSRHRGYLAATWRSLSRDRNPPHRAVAPRILGPCA